MNGAGGFSFSQAGSPQAIPSTWVLTKMQLLYLSQRGRPDIQFEGRTR